jgi:hypothetical protein
MSIGSSSQYRMFMVGGEGRGRVLVATMAAENN